jgi:hypothetical protein
MKGTAMSDTPPITKTKEQLNIEKAMEYLRKRGIPVGDVDKPAVDEGPPSPPPKSDKFYTEDEVKEILRIELQSLKTQDEKKKGSVWSSVKKFFNGWGWKALTLFLAGVGFFVLSFLYFFTGFDPLFFVRVPLTGGGLVLILSGVVLTTLFISAIAENNKKGVLGTPVNILFLIGAVGAILAILFTIGGN